MLFVEVKAYDDFDILYTDSIWYSDGYSSIKETGINEEGHKNHSDPRKVIKELKKMGFKEIKTDAITVGGNL